MGMWLGLGFQLGNGAKLEAGITDFDGEIGKERPDMEGYGRLLDTGPSLFIMGDANAEVAVSAATSATAE
jgi:hypothetical protein